MSTVGHCESAYRTTWREVLGGGGASHPGLCELLEGLARHWPSTALKNKTLSANAVIAAVDQAVELAGGAGFYRRFGLEQLLRDVRAAHYHPLPERRQVRFSGRVALGLPPV